MIFEASFCCKSGKLVLKKVYCVKKKTVTLQKSMMASLFAPCLRTGPDVAKHGTEFEADYPEFCAKQKKLVIGRSASEPQAKRGATFRQQRKRPQGKRGSGAAFHN